jgi:hypothetical protein
MQGHGGVAQGLEQSAHNRLVAGSNPAAPTTTPLLEPTTTLVGVDAVRGCVLERSVSREASAVCAGGFLLCMEAELSLVRKYTLDVG